MINQSQLSEDLSKEIEQKQEAEQKSEAEDSFELPKVVIFKSQRTEKSESVKALKAQLAAQQAQLAAQQAELERSKREQAEKERIQEAYRILNDMQRSALKIQSDLKQYISKWKAKVQKIDHEWDEAEALPEGPERFDRGFALVAGSHSFIQASPGMIEKLQKGIDDLEVIHQLQPHIALSVWQYEEFERYSKWVGIYEIQKNYWDILQKERQRNPKIVKDLEEIQKIRAAQQQQAAIQYQRELEAERKKKIEAEMANVKEVQLANIDAAIVKGEKIENIRYPLAEIDDKRFKKLPKSSLEKNQRANRCLIM